MFFDNGLQYKLTLKQVGYKKTKKPNGRLEKIVKKIKVFIYYIPQCNLKFYLIKKITLGKLFLVFGCGGDRDKSKEVLWQERQLNIQSYNNYWWQPEFEKSQNIVNDMINELDSKDLKKIKIIKNRKRQ